MVFVVLMVTVGFSVGAYLRGRRDEALAQQRRDVARANLHALAWNGESCPCPSCQGPGQADKCARCKGKRWVPMHDGVAEYQGWPNKPPPKLQTWQGKQVNPDHTDLFD